MIMRIKATGALLVFGSVLGIMGCTTSGLPASASFASVTILGVSETEINAATIAVFRENGYDEPMIGPDDMEFNKEGSRSNTLAYDGLRAMQDGQTTINRVNTELVKLTPDSYRLQCQAYIISGLDSNRERENRLYNMKSEPYQKMLDDIAQRLNPME